MLHLDTNILVHALDRRAGEVTLWRAASSDTPRWRIAA
jgi:hypothetical protein